MTGIPMNIASQPGIRRDGTRLSSKHYLDGRWTRFVNGRPRKMGGYQKLYENLNYPIGGLHAMPQPSSNQKIIYAGTQAELLQFRVSVSGGSLQIQDIYNRTPAGFGGWGQWQFDTLYDVGIGTTAIIGFATNGITNASIWYGGASLTTPLIDSTCSQVNGGIVVIGNYLVSFGEGGYVAWTNANNIGSGNLASTFVGNSRIIAGKRIRGGGVPAGLLWTEDSLILMTQGSSPLWSFDTLSAQVSLVGPKAVIEYDGVFYWMGKDRFYMFNGGVRELPNPMNADWLFREHFLPDEYGFYGSFQSAVFTFAVPAYGEIWWCFPYVENNLPLTGLTGICTHAVIYNVRENTWYDTILPDGGRTAGLTPGILPMPLMGGAESYSSSTLFDLWMHEVGTNKHLGSAALERNESPLEFAIQSYFETHEHNMLAAEQPASTTLTVSIVEPDFKQSGDLSVTVRGRANARAQVRDSETKIISEEAEDSSEQVVRFKDARRLMSFRVESNELNGNYELGDTYAHIEANDARITE